MRICSNGHEEIVFTDHVPCKYKECIEAEKILCPLCSAKIEIKYYKQRVKELEEKIKSED